MECEMAVINYETASQRCDRLTLCSRNVSNCIDFERCYSDSSFRTFISSLSFDLPNLMLFVIAPFL